MTERQRAAAAAGVAVTTGVITLFMTGADTWYAWALVGGASLAVGYLARFPPLHLAQGRSTMPSQAPAAARPRAEPVPTPSAVGNERASYATRVTGLSHVYAVLLPSSEVGPQPLYIPLSGHNLYLELVVANASAVVLHGLSAEVTARAPLKPDGASMVAQPGPGLFLADDLAEAHRRSLENYRPLEVPHLEVLLDAEPSIVRPSLDADGRQAHPSCPEFPLLLQAGAHLRLVLAPITDDRRHVYWRLLADIECEGTRNSPSWVLQVTAETTFRTFHPDGREPEFTPVHELAPHWNVKYQVK